MFQCIKTCMYKLQYVWELTLLSKSAGTRACAIESVAQLRSPCANEPILGSYS